LVAVIVVLLLVGVYLLKQAEKPPTHPARGIRAHHAAKPPHVTPTAPSKPIPPHHARTQAKSKPSKPTQPVSPVHLRETLSGFNKQGGFFADYVVSRPGPVHVAMVFRATCWTAYWTNGTPVDYPAGHTYLAGEKAVFSAGHDVSIRIGDVFAPVIRVDGVELSGLPTQARGRVTTLTVTAQGG
jgi:hypothetical protein